MKQIRLLLADARRHQGLALIIVLSMLALATIVILAFLSVADTEHKSTTVYSASQASRRFADTAVNMVISQIRSGSARETAGVPVIHATQPGAVRKYARDGSFLAGYKLFSDKDMIFRTTGAGGNTDERNFVQNSEPPADWNAGRNIARYVDLNEPVIKGVAVDAKANADTAQIFFPVIDPRAAQSTGSGDGDIPVEGFTYDTTTALAGNVISNRSPDAKGSVAPPIVKPSTATLGNAADQLRLAMPVQWLYVLKDGAVGYLEDETLRFLVMNGEQGSINGSAPSATTGDQYGVPSDTNPIIGRIAFWTDDETCKVNINTASEPTFAGQPIYYHERDHRWADYPPARSEYQRFPGHPATVALSSVLYPNPLQSPDRSLDTYGLTGVVNQGDLSRALAVKERIYNLMPKINTGGSLAGTRTFEQDDYRTSSGDSNNASAVAIRDALKERLYASVDELLFSQSSSEGKRVVNDAVVGGVTLFNKQSLERYSAFLTAHSRASEINLFGLPRIAMWPISMTDSKRTAYDKLIEFCSRLGTTQNNYIFQREKSNSATYDIESIPRNQQLLNMLDKLLASPFPTGVGGGQAGSFREKLGGGSTTVGEANARQIIISMFDYIRCTNLYDSFMVPQNRSSWPTAAVGWNGTNAINIFTAREQSKYQTFTPGIFRNASLPSNPFEDRFFPGHGQVTPIEHPSPTWLINSSPARGFGRFVSVSEIGLHFICTADGQPDMYSWRLPVKNPNSADPNNYIIPDIQTADLAANAEGSIPLVSGGRTALRVLENSEIGSFAIEHAYTQGFAENPARLTNLEAVHWTTPGAPGANTSMVKRRYYSNYPPLSQPKTSGFYGTTDSPGNVGDVSYGRYYGFHPGYDWKNWNYSLERDTPLEVNEKRIQGMVHLEFFCPSVAYTEINPEFSVVLSAEHISGIQVNGRAIFNTTQDVIIRSEHPLFETDGHPEVGGFASFRNLALGRRVKGIRALPADNGYEEGVNTQAHGGLLNLDLVSSFFTVKSDQPLNFSSNEMELKIYDHHVKADDLASDTPVQVIRFRLEQGQAPTPDIIVTGTYWVNYIRTTDSLIINHPPTQAPRWWSFNRDGILGRVNPEGGAIINPDDDTNLRSIRGRFYRQEGDNWAISNTSATSAIDPRRPTAVADFNQSMPGGQAIIYTRDQSNFKDVRVLPPSYTNTNPLAKIAYGRPSDNPNIQAVDLNKADGDPWDRPWHYGSDVVRTLQPAHGDARLIAVKKNVPASDWTPHRLWNRMDSYIAHNFSSYTAGTEAGFDRGMPIYGGDVDNKVRGLPENVKNGTALLHGNYSPDIPHGRSDYAPTPMAAYQYMQRYYDFDDSDTGGRVGPFINKVDEGNYAVGDFKPSGWPVAKKWRATYYRSDSQGARFANGSGSYFTPNRLVPSPVVMGSLPSQVWTANGNGAWTNLLFHPYVSLQQSVTGSIAAPGAIHPGAQTPPDHYLLDLFWMPVVEPYAISESLSTAGKINLNYQIMPFTHIRRATALHAAMKGEIMAAMPNSQYQESKSVKSGWGLQGSTPPVFLSETDGKFWHHGIVVDRFKPSSGADTPWWQLNTADLVQGTLRQFEERFNFGVGRTSGQLLPGFNRAGLFRTASQICEVHLIPTQTGNGFDVTPTEVQSADGRRGAMERFWGQHCSTGDNTRERPYANLYAKFTTRSNTFRVHVRAQSIRKATRSVAADVFEPEKDLPVSEFRGSFLIERYIDQADLAALGTAVDYASKDQPLDVKPLENYYRFRVLESKRFAP